MNGPATAFTTDALGARKQITAVFIDVVDFSNVASTADPEDLQDWLDALYTQSRRIIEAHDGEVTEYLGDGIVAFFGLRKADELAASKAVNAALTALSDIDARNEKGIAVELRIGIATGEVAVRERIDTSLPRATGLVTTLAKRIQEKANPGHVLISETTFALLRDTVAVEPVPGLALKGLGAAQMLYRPLRKQPLAQATTQQVFFGREKERAQIAKTKQPVLIIGQAGIGKSALARYVAQSANHATTIAGDGVQMRASYQPFMHWITKQTAQRLPDYADLQTTFVALDEKALCALAIPLGLPEGQRLLAELSNVALKPLIEGSIWNAIRTVHPNGLVVFEDLHWFDNASLDVLVHILRNSDTAQHSFLMTSREDATNGPYLNAIPLTTIALAPLDDASAGEMITALAPDEMTPSSQAELLEKAAGIPLFLEQLAKWQSTAASNGDVPSSLMDLLSEQIDATGPAKAVLQCAAVIGQKFDLHMLEVIAPSGGTIEGRLLIAEAKGVVQQLGATQWAFCHALLQQAAYQGILRRNRVQLHAQLAEHLQTHHADAVRRTPALLTDHLILGEHYVAAIQNYLSVSQWALFQGALRDADTHIVDAIALCQKVPADVDSRALEISCQATRGAILMQTQGFTATPVRKVFERISELAVKQNAHAAENGPAFYGSFTHALAMGDKSRAAWFAEKLRETANHITEKTAHYDLQQAALNVDVAYHFYSGAFGKASQAFAQMRALYDVNRRQSMMANYGIDGFSSAQMFEVVNRAICGDSHLVPALSAETDAHQDVLNTPIMRPYALIWGGVALSYAGQRRRALDRIAKGVALAETSASAYWELTGAVWTFILDPSKSGNSKGLAAFEQTLQAHEMIGANLTLPLYRVHYAMAVLRQGDADKAHQIAQQARQEAEQSGLCCWHAEILRISATIFRAVGREDTSRKMLSEAAQIAAQQGANLWLLRTRLDQYRLGLVGIDALREVVATFDASAALPELDNAHKALGLQ